MPAMVGSVSHWNLLLFLSFFISFSWIFIFIFYYSAAAKLSSYFLSMSTPTSSKTASVPPCLWKSWTRRVLCYSSLCGFEWSDTVTWCMVEWCTQNLRRNGSISRGTSQATTTERCQYTTSMDINNTRYQRIQSLLQNHMRHATESHATMNNNNNLMNWWMWGEKISLIWKGRKRFWAVLCQGFCFIVLSYIVEHCNPICIAFTLV